MTTNDAASPATAAGQLPIRRVGRWSRLCAKELRETLRDRRTLATLILMPLLVYPILSMVFQRSLLSSWSSETPKLVVGVPSTEFAEWFQRTLAAGDGYLKQERPPETKTAAAEVPASAIVTPPGEQAGEPTISWFVHEDLATQVAQERIDLGIRGSEEQGAWRIELVYRAGSALSQRALRFVEDRLQAGNEAILRERLKQAGKSDQLTFQATRRAIRVTSADATLSTIVPMILILMTVTGAVYPAIDLTAGERERGTLEMLMASPVPRLRLLLSKYVAVVTVAFLTALVNLLAMTITLEATGLSGVLFGEAGLTLAFIIQILSLLILFAAFFSAVLLALTSFARSFKEAQAYLIPLMLLSLGPSIVSLLPGLELRGLLAITPVSNMVLLARDLCGGGVNPLMALVAVASTVLYTLAAVAVAARIFGTDAVLSGGPAEWSDVFGRSRDRQVASITGALVCLAALFPVYFIVANSLGRLRDVPLSIRLAATGLATSLLFGVLPGLAARLQRLDMRRTFQFRAAPAATFLAALLLGLTLWPLAHEIFFLNRWLGLASFRPEQIEAVEKLLKDWRDLNPVWILISMAAAPAVFEELFFRGYLFSALRAAASRRATVWVSALLFGLFHVASSNALSTERFLPSTFLGLVLGWLCYRTGSVLPGMLLHASHNGFLLMIAYYRDALVARGWGMEEESHLPASWVAGSAGALLLGVLVVKWATPADRSPSAAEKQTAAIGE